MKPSFLLEYHSTFYFITSARPGRPSKRISAAMPTPAQRNGNPACETTSNGQFGSSPFEPSGKIPRKHFTDPITMNRNTSISRASVYSSIPPLPYASSLASFCMNPDNIGRFLTDTEPFIQAMNNLSTALIHPSQHSSANYSTTRVPLIPTDRITNTSADRGNDDVTVISQLHRNQTVRRPNLCESRTGLYSTPTSENSGSSPIYSRK